MVTLPIAKAEGVYMAACITCLGETGDWTYRVLYAVDGSELAEVACEGEYCGCPSQTLLYVQAGLLSCDVGRHTVDWFGACALCGLGAE